jgi:hypothetical protein
MIKMDEGDILEALVEKPIVYCLDEDGSTFVDATTARTAKIIKGPVACRLVSEGKSQLWAEFALDDGTFVQGLWSQQWTIKRSSDGKGND